MKNFTGSLGMVISFLVLTLLVQVFFGDKVTFWFLALVLGSMVIYNSGVFTTFLGRFNNNG